MRAALGPWAGRRGSRCEGQLMPSKEEIEERRRRLSGSKLALLEKRLRGEPQGGDATPAAPADARRSPAGRSPLVKIQAGGPGRPLFLGHPSNGSVFCYRELAKHLGTERHIYGLQSPGLDAEPPGRLGLEEMARGYVEAVRGVQPEGPYLLAGWSMGGVIAYEIAQQLLKRGERIALLALIDIYPRPARERGEYDNIAELEWFLKELSLSFGKEAPVSSEALRRLGPRERLTYVLEQVRAADFVDAETELPYLRRVLEVFEGNINALMSYEPEPYAGRITLFKTGEPPGESPRAPRVEYNTLAVGGIDVYAVPGEHFTVLREPHVRLLARELQDCLADQPRP